MSGVDITKEATKPELYSRIFAEKGGIFDKFSYDGDGYDYGNQILRDSKNIQKYLGFLQEIAFEMFDEEKLSLPRKEDKIPKLTFEGTEISVLEFPIKHLFDNTLSNIEFVHKSIYEYFVVEYIVKNIKDVLKIDDYKEKLACFFGKTLLHGNITYEIIELLKYKINNSDLKDSYHKVAEVFHVMLKDGMIYHTNMRFKKAIICEMTVFANMLEVLHLWERFIYLFDDTIIDYLYFKYKKSLNLSGANLSGANLSGVDLSRADLERADLKGADLRHTIFYENQVQQLKRKCDLKDSKVVISKNGKNKTILQKCLFNLLKL